MEIEVFGLECAKQLDELMHVQQQYVLALKRQTTTQEVYDELKRELDGERSVLRSLERTHRMLSGSQETRDKYGTTDEEVKTIREKLERKEPEVRLLARRTRSQKAVVAVSNSAAATLGDSAKAKEAAAGRVGGRAAVQHRLDPPHREAPHRVVGHGGQLKQHEKQFAKESRRKRTVGDELKRVANHPGKHISSAVWNEGVMQRLSTKDLYINLTNEFKGLRMVCLTSRSRSRTRKSGRFGSGSGDVTASCCSRALRRSSTHLRRHHAAQPQ